MPAPTPDTPLDLSVIIVNYNVRHFLEQCLLSVEQALEAVRGEVIVVDNASRDDSVAMVRERFGERVRLLANTDNPGFSRANNQGIALARGRHILLLNPDTLVAPDTFRICLDFMDAHPEAGALGVQMIDGHGHFLPESKRALPTPAVSFYKIFGLASLFPRSHRFGQYHLSYLDKDQDHAIEILSGAFMWLRKETLDQVGLLDETFFMYGEDIDLSYRVLLGGYQNYYLARTRILHYKGESTKKGSLNYVRVFYQAMIIFAEKHFGGRRKQVFIAAIRLAVYFRALLAILRRLAQRLSFPLLEGGLIYATMYGIQAYWEHYVKYIEGGAYPAVLKQVYMPVYTLIFVGFLWLAGAYRRPFRLRPLVLAPVGGFIAIATGTYMFPFIHNFSRAIVGLSAVFTMLIALATRGLLNRREKGSFFITEERSRRALLVGAAPDIARVEGLLRGAWGYPVTVAGAVMPPPLPGDARPHAPWAGPPEQLAALVSLYRADEVIFCQGSYEAGQILDQMVQLKDRNLRFKIAPPGRDFLIGPQDILTAGGDSGALALNQPGPRRAKRGLDRLGSGLLLLGFPLLFWAYRRPGAAARGLWRSLLGRATLIGYAGHGEGLPALPPGLLSPLDRLAQPSPSLSRDALDQAYARSYHWTQDLDLLLRAWRRIGLQNKG